MPGDDRQDAIARVYAEALFRLSEARGESEQLLGELAELVRFSREHPGIAEPLLSPLADPAKRRASIDRIFRGRASDLFVDTLQVLNARGRLALFAAVAEAFRKLFQRSRQVLDVHVETAVPLSAEQRAALAELTLALTGSRANLLESVEPRLLGGLVVRARDRKFDTSLRSKLDRLRGLLSQRASQEIILARGQAS
ncbi:MAG: ATP synthase F1 subunit delta [Thermoanaerobaculia bacterium]|nr:ATP synthase F1 subunit delta [Thermoanaerobaculia bacterium]MCZ7652785.1 ATP synthase F1 subunit delta [Thermoanaerobaculia bacterium]